ncbi:peptidase S8 and S53 subtilisin kexin sedolisin [Pseudomonas sichuanensis]|uniref:subtilisin-like serine protease QhpE n=1 Tax=Pseudomonas sichuanensis TaxID=2213015 RepID=UPI002447960D|nr:peptidase S8 and S53 subtilisin kexin sedolisin [Pseudomonas sichuanensis]MDH0733331.1 peptidase S8 and S53 subtilisin kexin sedolisin [Pseudomonas sichuanensis]MDH1581134.1 peptidase S8 and S53 subtilisin kexin sedolisin [Pseudomonas sichuanensis]MDH1591005.1 peptidase S8 and S53 subtilisin kexin sedolisin [Pseudomonas sichuanensis]MDH1596674.1 peptidase S8 and S53 subtilisin kexin sedolisin [Pseudomonas sichuanensis]
MATDLRVGVIDSGCSLEQANGLLDARRFWLADGQLREGELLPDQLGHGSAVLASLQRETGPVPLLVAQVFIGQASTSALQVAAALLWLVEAGATLVNLSLGLQQDRPVLHQACAEALAAGVLLCASSPAQGGPVYPASYPGVIRITGDARCGPGQWSWLGTRQADFGGYAGAGGRAGASLGCAALSGRIAALLRNEPGMDRQQVHDWLRRHATFTGPERRGASHA